MKVNSGVEILQSLLHILKRKKSGAGIYEDDFLVPITDNQFKIPIQLEIGNSFL